MPPPLLLLHQRLHTSQCKTQCHVLRCCRSCNNFIFYISCLVFVSFSLIWNILFMNVSYCLLLCDRCSSCLLFCVVLLLLSMWPTSAGRVEAQLCYGCELCSLRCPVKEHVEFKLEWKYLVRGWHTGGREESQSNRNSQQKHLSLFIPPLTRHRHNHATNVWQFQNYLEQTYIWLIECINKISSLVCCCIHVCIAAVVCYKIKDFNLIWLSR